MNKQEVTDLGFEIVAYSGEARSELLTALKKAMTRTTWSSATSACPATSTLR